eukprot:NODE_2128_length_2287_cov_3.573148.p1 GENE.NODE_2128_length_2287_cov_3.573148~~NODE_2128_length_2287_cov_3.573148.p1  ORF type:complete len:527 (+),score=132.16 NODE_2128_length_2287_cov_3.573148:322-1902(+)
MALRLVAHAQVGNPLSPEMAGIEPPRVAELRGLDVSGGGGCGGFGGGGNGCGAPRLRSPSEVDPFDLSEWSSTSSLPPRTWRWTPSARQLRKYASLFLRVGGAERGAVACSEAYALGERSGFAANTLSLALALADVDMDGRLLFAEFVAFAHLLACCRRGAVLPRLEEGVPAEFVAVLATLGSPEELDAQRSSRSTSPAGARTLSSGSWRSASAFAGKVAPPSGPVPWLERGRQAAGASDTERSGSPSPRFGHNDRPLSPRQLTEPLDAAAIAKQFSAVAEADRILSWRLCGEADALGGKIRGAREAAAEVSKAVQQKCDEAERTGDFVRHLEWQLLEARRRLAEVSEAGSPSRVVDDQLASGRQHAEEQLALLQRSADDEDHYLEAMRQANAVLDRSCRGLEAQTLDIAAFQADLHEEVLAEAELLRREERTTQELRVQVEDLRSTWTTVGGGFLPAPANGPAMGDAGASASGPSPAPAPHSWAFSLVGAAAVSSASPSLAGGGTASGSLRRGPGITNPWSREGV